MRTIVSLFILILFSFDAYSQVSDSIPLPKTVTALYPNTPLRDSPDPNTEISYRVPKNSTLEVIGSFETYFRVKLDSLEGYVSYTLVRSYSNEFREFVNNAKLIELEKKKIKIEESQKVREKELTQKYGAWAASRILERKIWIGMTEEMLNESLGEPLDINSTVTSYSVRKQYVYSRGRYIYVVNGKVDAWQNF